MTGGGIVVYSSPSGHSARTSIKLLKSQNGAVLYCQCDIHSSDMFKPIVTAQLGLVDAHHAYHINDGCSLFLRAAAEAVGEVNLEKNTLAAITKLICYHRWASTQA
ncbi:hypothetical protein ACJX0J_033362, partial [Zea mays]